jgi:PIN domain nuclease of toxin-antitoxin system
VRYLADTHALLWWAEDSSRLSRRARSVFARADSEILFSVASSWELSIKLALGRVKLSTPLDEFLHVELPRQAVDVFPIDTRHVVRTAGLPPHHRDPFDRMLIAQALVEDIPVLTADPLFTRYGVDVVW